MLQEMIDDKLKKTIDETIMELDVDVQNFVLLRYPTMGTCFWHISDKLRDNLRGRLYRKWSDKIETEILKGVEGCLK